MAAGNAMENRFLAISQDINELLYANNISSFTVNDVPINVYNITDISNNVIHKYTYYICFNDYLKAIGVKYNFHDLRVAKDMDGYIKYPDVLYAYEYCSNKNNNKLYISYSVCHKLLQSTMYTKTAYTTTNKQLLFNEFTNCINAINAIDYKEKTDTLFSELNEENDNSITSNFDNKENSEATIEFKMFEKEEINIPSEKDTEENFSIEKMFSQIFDVNNMIKDYIIELENRIAELESENESMKSCNKDFKKFMMFLAKVMTTVDKFKDKEILNLFSNIYVNAFAEMMKKGLKPLNFFNDFNRAMSKEYIYKNNLAYEDELLISACFRLNGFEVLEYTFCTDNPYKEFVLHQIKNQLEIPYKYEKFFIDLMLFTLSLEVNFNISGTYINTNIISKTNKRISEWSLSDKKENTVNE